MYTGGTQFSPTIGIEIWEPGLVKRTNVPDVYNRSVHAQTGLANQKRR